MILDTVIHDIKSPLASIQSITALLRLKPNLERADLLKALDKIDEKTRFLNENADALYELAVLQENTYTLTREFIELSELLSQYTQTKKSSNFIVGDKVQLIKAFRLIYAQLQRISGATTPIEIVIKKSSKKISVQYTYSGVPLINKKSKDPFELSSFLPFINKTVRLSFFIAVSIIRLHEGEVMFRALTKDTFELEVQLPIK